MYLSQGTSVVARRRIRAAFSPIFVCTSRHRTILFSFPLSSRHISPSPSEESRRCELPCRGVNILSRSFVDNPFTGPSFLCPPRTHQRALTRYKIGCSSEAESEIPLAPRIDALDLGCLRRPLFSLHSPLISSRPVTTPASHQRLRKKNHQ